MSFNPVVATLLDSKRKTSARDMKAAIVNEFGKSLSVEDVPAPEPAPGQVLVKIEACGVCEIDLHSVDGDWAIKPPLPFIPGHEGVGIVTALGRGVKAVKEGDCVGVPWLHTACGHCRDCIQGLEALCVHQKNTGYSVNGGFAEYVIADPNFVIRIPDSVDFPVAAPILCGGVKAYCGLKGTRARRGETVVVIGTDSLGQLALQYAKAMGMHVIAVDAAGTGLHAARTAGAELTINAAGIDPVIELQKIGGADAVIATVASPKSLSQGVKMLRPGGIMSIVGLPMNCKTSQMFKSDVQNKTIRGSITGNRVDLQEALEFAADGKVKPNFATDSLKNINRIFDQMRDGASAGCTVLQLA